MSRSADIDFIFDAPVDVREVMRALTVAGASFVRDGTVVYVFDEDEMFGWESVDSVLLDGLILQAGALPQDRVTIGFSMWLDGSEVGGDLLFHKERKMVSFLVTINRRHLLPSSSFCDFGWYLQRMVPALEPLGLSEIVARDSA